jgi:hypothetical protein
MKRLIAATISMIAFASIAMADTQPFQASLTPDIAIHDQSTFIKGLTLSIWGENPQKSLAIGIANGTTGDSAGFSLGWLLNYGENYRGVSWACVNYTTGDVLGWQGAFVNYSGGSMTGLQTGCVNYANRMKGLQLGLLNFAESTNEALVQIGLLNLIRDNGSWFGNFPDEVAPAMVIVNWSF